MLVVFNIGGVGGSIVKGGTMDVEFRVSDIGCSAPSGPRMVNQQSYSGHCNPKGPRAQ